MNNLLRRISKRTILITTIFLFVGGIALAYFTNDAEPWGTIGGLITGMSIFWLIICPKIAKTI